jgi:hypothetical protein
MASITLTWHLPLEGSEIKIANQRLSRLHVELDRWHTQYSPAERIILLLQPKAYTYQCELDEDLDTTLLFLTTWQGMAFKVT